MGLHRMVVRRRRERFDGLVSAALDDRSGAPSGSPSGNGLSHEEREELERLVATDEALAARARALAGVDDSLRALAADAVSDERLAPSLAALRTKLAATSGPASGWKLVGAPDVRRHPRNRTVGVAPAVLAVAAAAALVPMNRRLVMLRPLLSEFMNSLPISMLSGGTRSSCTSTIILNGFIKRPCDARREGNS